MLCPRRFKGKPPADIVGDVGFDSSPCDALFYAKIIIFRMSSKRDSLTPHTVDRFVDTID